MLSWKAERQYFGTRGSFRNRAKTGVNATKPPLMTRSASHCAGRVALEREQHHAGPSPAVRMFERSQVVARLISFRYGEKAREVACGPERLGHVCVDQHLRCDLIAHFIGHGYQRLDRRGDPGAPGAVDGKEGHTCADLNPV